MVRMLGDHMSAESTAATHFECERRVQRGDPDRAVDLLARESGLAKGRVKDAMNKGAVWLSRRGRGGRERLRRATATLRPGDSIALYYDAAVLAQRPPSADCVLDREAYSVWDKPAGLLTQGTRYGDHCALLRQVERSGASGREVYLIHRLDREARGLVLIAHQRAAAAALSKQWQARSVEKHYWVQVLGALGERLGEAGEINLSLDGKPATTAYRSLGYDAAANVTTVDVTMRTGRRHQIRRHFAGVGFPVMGDPRYGRGNKNREGLRLIATALRFRCPLRGDDVQVALAELEPETER